MRKNLNSLLKQEKDYLIKGSETSSDEYVLNMVGKLSKIGFNGLQVKGFGSPGLTTLEAGAIVYELAKADMSLASFVLVHNAIGMSIIEALGSEE